MASDFKGKFNEFMARRNGPDQLMRDSLALSIVLLIIGAFLQDGARTVLLVLGAALMAYSYFRMFSSDSSARSRENSSYLEKRSSISAKLKAPFAGAARQGRRAAAQATEQAKDREHRYFACPKCGQRIRVPKGAGKIRVTCPKCGEKFEKRA